ncbi:MAG: hypothetical protein CMJ95_05245 [Planctomycetes bacterium]|nr:hypothetical protein [Planctomycetota bacterium]
MVIPPPPVQNDLIAALSPFLQILANRTDLGYHSCRSMRHKRAATEGSLKMSKKKLLWTVWAVVPALLAIWWFGPGQDLQARTRVASTVEQAMTAADGEDWKLAAELFGQAIGEAPANSPESNRWLRLRASHSEFMSGNTWNGISGMEEVLSEIKDTDPELARDARARIAAAQYFATWKLRLEGAKPEVWKPEAEKARQHFRLLAEDAEARGAKETEDLKKNVESVIWLERLDLAELQSLPLPGGC